MWLRSDSLRLLPAIKSLNFSYFRRNYVMYEECAKSKHCPDFFYRSWEPLTADRFPELFFSDWKYCLTLNCLNLNYVYLFSMKNVTEWQLRIFYEFFEVMHRIGSQLVLGRSFLICCGIVSIDRQKHLFYFAALLCKAKRWLQNIHEGCKIQFMDDSSCIGIFVTNACSCGRVARKFCAKQTTVDCRELQLMSIIENYDWKG